MYDQAVNDCTKAIELDPNYVKAYLRRAHAYTLMEKHQEAVWDYDKAKSLDPENKGIPSTLVYC